MSPRGVRLRESSTSRTRGTTIIPAIIVILVIAAYALLALRNARTGAGTLREKATADIHVLDDICREHQLQSQGRFASSLADLIRPDSPVRARIGPELPRDPWGREYRYEPPNAEFDFPRIWTYGRDGLPGGKCRDADLGNWMLR